MADTTLNISQTAYRLKVQKGEVSGTRVMEAFGERDGFGTTVAGEDVWRGNQLSPAASVRIPIPPEAGDLMSVVCENGNDTILGTGARKVEIHYIKPDGTEATLEVDLNGGTVATGVLMRFIQYIHVTEAGTGLVAAGNIKIMKTGGSTSADIYNMILAGGNMSTTTNRMIPLGKALYLQGWDASEGNNDRITIRIRSTDDKGVLIPGVFLFKDSALIRASTTGPMYVSAIIPALSIMKITGWGISAGAEVSAGWWGYLVDN